MKQTLTAILFGLGLSALAETPTITGVTARQRYPWNGKVDITYTITGDVAAEAAARGRMTPTLHVTATDRTTGNTYTASSLSGDTGLSDGTHALVWDMNADGLAFMSDDVVFEISCEIPPQYCIINLSGGANSSSYPITYLEEPPGGGFNTDDYKTTKLVLRRIDAGSFIMGGDQTDESYRVTLTKPFYCGVFEVTQKQWELVMGTRPSHFSNDSDYATRPVEQVSYNMIRGSSLGAQWPASDAIDADSFLGKLRMRAGIDFDLPTEAQWEYACRAGTTTDFNSGNNYTNSSQDAAMDEVGRYWHNGGSGSSASSTAANGTAIVGSYQPNAWGLYDMHGNVWEWCLDWYGGSLSGTDPVGSFSGSKRVERGGSWRGGASRCTSSFRVSDAPSYSSSNNGFRLVRTLSDAFYKISFNSGGGSAVPLITASYGSALTAPPSPTRDGYTFAGWSPAVPATMPATDMVCFAQWIPRNYTITFDSAGGSTVPSVTAAYGSTLTPPAIPTKDGWTFAGWSPSFPATMPLGGATLTAQWTKAYLVVDLSGGANASTYPVTYLEEPPAGGFNTDEYKTTKLVLRRLEPGPIPTRDATITKTFYVGLFEVTQNQWELVMGTRPSYFSNDSYYATRPVEQVSYDMIRGSSLGAQWPASNAVDADSFLGKLRARTGVDFDLPTEAQWEYACRAGTTTDFNSGKNCTNTSQNSDMDEVGRYWYNGGSGYSSSCTTANGTAAVGSYLPNAWGLYDMHGNVREWCLDWTGGSLSGNDPVGSSSGSCRVERGGSWVYGANRCTSSYWSNNDPSLVINDSGFRLVRALSN